MRQNYSRQRSTEQRQNMRSAAMYIGLTIGALILILFFGIPAIGRVAAFLHDLRTSGQPIDANDSTPPAPPSLDNLPEFTNKSAIDVEGRTEPGAIVRIKANGEEAEVVANNEGVFLYEWELLKGENKISAKARDAAGNESQDSQIKILTYDNQAPDLEITSPADGTTFSGTRARQATIEGKTESRVTVTINDRIVAVDTDGNFSFFTTLTDGENKFIIKARDQGGNETEKSLTLRFNP